MLALLKDAIYIEDPQGYVVCIAHGDAVDGPLTMRVPSFDTLRSSPDVVDGAEFTVTLHSLTIGGAAHILWANALPWSPLLPFETRSPLLPSRLGPAEARQAAAYRLAWFLSVTQPQDASRSKGRIGEALHAFLQAMRTQQIERAAVAICSLLGTGEGLTPEGDDLAMGLLASLVWWANLGKLDTGVLQQLVQAVREVAPRITNKVSARLLWHAGEGLLYAPAMELGAALLAGRRDDVLAPSQRLLAVGNSTGRSVATGILRAIQLIA